jgi:hypothetical protein
MMLALAAAILMVTMVPAYAQPPVPVWQSHPAAAGAAPTAAEATAPAAVDPTTDLGGYARAVIDAIRGGRWMAMFGLMLVGLVAAARWGLGRVVPWFKTDRGGTVLAAATAFMAVLGSGLAAGAAFGLDLVSAALAAAAAAIGLFTGAKRLIAPKDRRA